MVFFLNSSLAHKLNQFYSLFGSNLVFFFLHLMYCYHNGAFYAYGRSHFVMFFNVHTLPQKIQEDYTYDYKFWGS